MTEMKKSTTGALRQKPAPPEARNLKTRAERYAAGKALRETCPRSSHAEWKPPHDRPDPIRLVLKADEGRVPELLPLRHGRMVLSPFTFYRGSALAMAVDLAGTPSTGVRVQCGGDSHLVNFRGLATPERKVIFAINDLDETLPAPWEWDLKRLAASFVIACRDNGLSESDGKDAVLTCVRSYREHMAEFSEMKAAGSVVPRRRCRDDDFGHRGCQIRRGAIKRLAKSRESSTSEGIFPKLVDSTGGLPVIKDQLPANFSLERSRRRRRSIRTSGRSSNRVPRNSDACPSHAARSLRDQGRRDQGRRRRERRHRLLDDAD